MAMTDAWRDLRTSLTLLIANEYTYIPLTSVVSYYATYQFVRTDASNEQKYTVVHT